MIAAMRAAFLAVGSELLGTDRLDTNSLKLTAVLARYGVVFRDLAVRESFTIPWRYVLRALRRLEARGVIRGGRFVIGVFHKQ